MSFVEAVLIGSRKSGSILTWMRWALRASPSPDTNAPISCASFCVSSSSQMMTALLIVRESAMILATYVPMWCKFVTRFLLSPSRYTIQESALSSGWTALRKGSGRKNCIQKPTSIIVYGTPSFWQYSRISYFCVKGQAW